MIVKNYFHNFLYYDNEDAKKRQNRSPSSDLFAVEKELVTVQYDHLRQPPQYPQPYIQQPPYPQRPYLPPLPTPQELYRKELRRTANGLGVLLLCFFGLQLILAVILEIPLVGMGLYDELTGDSPLALLLNGVLSMVIFFITALVYCLIRRLSFASLFPFEKTGGRMLARLCTVGIAFSLMSNYVVTLLSNTFGLFGVENSGGSFDVGSEPNVLIYFLTVAVLPALVEEFAFRGVVMGALRPYSEALAILVSSAAFALMHGNFVQLPFTFCCGLVFAFIDIKSNSLLPSIIVHFLNNGLSVLFDVLVSYQILDDYGANLGYGLIFAVTGVLTFIILKNALNRDPDFFRVKGGNVRLPYREKVKTVASSPTMISFAAVMLLYSVFVLVAL